MIEYAVTGARKFEWERRMKRILTLVALLPLWPMASAHAQQCFPPGTFNIAGYPFNCGAATTCIDNRIGDIGRAAPGQGILLHPILNSYPHGVIGFIFAHECAHFLGITDEQAADAWAIKTGRNQRWINQFTVRQICQSVYFSPGDWTHAPGPVRCQLMLHAFGTP
jgi:hypothetical protein